LAIFSQIWTGFDWRFIRTEKLVANPRLSKLVGFGWRFSRNEKLVANQGIPS